VIQIDLSSLLANFADQKLRPIFHEIDLFRELTVKQKCLDLVYAYEEVFRYTVYNITA